MKKPRLVVVGNGMAGIRTLEELFKLAPDRYEVTVFGAEPHPNYNRILLSPVLAGEQEFEHIVLNSLEWYAENDIRLHLGKEVTRIDRVRRRVIAADGTEAEYDRLLLATGSLPFILPVPGKDLKGVISYRDIYDTQTMIDTAKVKRHAVVIGGGLLGLEAANGLKLRGMEVTVVHLAGWLLERQLDPVAAGLLEKSLRERGLAFRLNTSTTEILGNEAGEVTGVRFSDGSEQPADLVVMAAGIRPNTQLAQEAGLYCNRGIVVSDGLQTYDPRVYAVGECASHRGIAYGLVAPLFEQAKICANHLAHYGIGIYQGSVSSTKLKVTGIDLFSAGNFMGGEGTEEIVLSDPAGGVYKKLVIQDEKLVGACLYGDTTDGGWYFKLLKDGRKVDDLRDQLMFGESALGDAGHSGQSRAMSMQDSDEVCGCNGVCKGTIVKAITGSGLFTLDEVKKHTKASSSCGSCTGLVEQILMNTLGSEFPADAQDQGGMRMHQLRAWRSAQGDPRTSPADPSRGLRLSGMAHAQRLRHLPTGDQLLPAFDLAARSGGRSAVAFHQRARARQHPERRHLLGDSADEGRRDQRFRTAPYRRRRRQVRGADGQGHRRPAHRSAGHQERRSAGGVEGPGHASGHAYGKSIRTVKTCVGSECCRFGTQDRTQMGIDLETMLGACGAAQGQAGGVRLPAQLRRIGHQGRGHHRVDSGWESMSAAMAASRPKWRSSWSR